MALYTCNLNFLMMGWGGEEILFEETITRNYPNLSKNKQKPYIQESHQTLSINNMKEATSILIIKLLKIRVKQKILNTARKKWCLDRRTKVNIVADFLIRNNIYKKIMDKYFLNTDINMCPSWSPYLVEYFSQMCEEKDILDTKFERIYHLKTHITGNVKGNKKE